MHRLLLLLGLLLAGPAAAQESHGGPVRALAVLADGRVASGGFDQAIILWDPALRRALRVFRWHTGAVDALAALPDGSLASGGAEGLIGLWTDPMRDWPTRELIGHGGPIAALAAAADGRLGSASWDGTARIWNPANGAAEVLEGHQGQVTGIAFTAEGPPATAGADGTIRLWQPGEPPLTIADLGLPQTALVAVPGLGLAAAGVDGRVRLLAPGAAPRVLEVGPRPVVALAASPDGRLLAAGTIGGGVTLWSLPEGKLLRGLDGPGLPVWSLAFGAGGSVLYTGGGDRQLRRWAVTTGQPLDSPQDAAPPADPAAIPGVDRRGAAVFRACAACHGLSADAGPQAGPAMAGPTLAGIFGRRMGSVPGYAYSPRLARGDIVWTPETVAALFTQGPDRYTPGTRMPVQRVEDPEDMAALLRFLEQATRP